jgi:hypothetical protein
MMRRSWLVSLGLAAALKMSIACSIFGDFSVEQCESDADCTNIGLAGYRCMENRICAHPDAGNGGGGGEAGGGGGATCTSNAQCTTDNLDIPHVCNRTTGQCAQLRDDEACRTLAGDWTEDELVILGVFVPLRPGSDLNREPSLLSVQLAVDEINASGGIPGAAGEAPRQLLTITCDQFDEDTLSGVVRRLVDEVGVHGFVGELESASLQSLILSDLAGQFFLATRANDESLKGIAFNDQGLLWHGLDDITELADVFPPVLLDAEQRAIALGATPDDVRMAIVASPSFGMGKLRVAAEPELIFNGQDITANGDNFLRVTLPFEGPSADYTSAVDELVAFEPHVVMGFAGDEFGTIIIPALEEGLSGAAPQPVYVASPGSRYSNLLLSSAQFNDFSTRFVGVEFLTNAALYGEYESRLEDAFFNAPAPTGYNVLYDAIYMTSLAVFAAGNVATLTPEGIVEGLKRLDDPRGEEVQVGTTAPTGINTFKEGLELLTIADGVQFIGTTGPLTFSDSDGSRIDMARGTYCLDEQADSSVRFRFGAQTLEGTELSGTPCW